MSLAATISRYLLGFVFLVFGLNGFAHFIPQPPMAGLMGEFMTAVHDTRMYVVIFGTQTIGGALLLVGRYVPLALVALAGVIVNIFFFHVFVAPAGLPLAVIVIVLWVLVALKYRPSFAGILAP